MARVLFLEQDIAALIGQHPQFAELFDVARDLFEGDPRALDELLTFARFSLEKKREDSGEDES